MRRAFTVLALIGCAVAIRVNPYTGAYQNFSAITGGSSFSHSSKIVHPPPQNYGFHQEQQPYQSSYQGSAYHSPSYQAPAQTGPYPGPAPARTVTYHGAPRPEPQAEYLQASRYQGGNGYGLNRLPYSLPYSQPAYGPTGNSLGGLPYGAEPAPPQCNNKLTGPCQDNKYRTIDGSCNNLRNPSWGMTDTPYSRLLPARYTDGIHLPPRSVTGHKLPSARLISIVLFPDVPIPDPVWTLNSMQWGQLITHDMSMSMGTSQTKPLANQCCSPDGRIQIPLEQAPAQCFAISIPEDDPLYSKFGQMCMNFMRSTTDVERGCAPPNKPHDQIVVVSHYMDGSMTYGSTQEVADSLRAGVGGLLRVEMRRGRPWPPSASNKSATCETQDNDEPCYLFGDTRANQNPQLTVLQIVMLREHNRIASALHQLNPHWDDETLFQEARRILVAEWQHINYAEWLPIFIGTKNMMKYGLLYKTDGYVNDYREDVDPSVLNGHATAAFRYFHSAIQGQIQLISEHRSVYAALRLSDYFNKPGIIEEGDNMDNLARGLATQNEEEVDPFFTSEITDYLFRNGMPFGRDLRAIDIQRSRDHGLPSYNDYRAFCGLPKAKSWEDFRDYISPENVDKLSLLYAHPDDVDVVVGGTLESHVEDTLAGPTFVCIMLEQFYRARVGDRFFYENGNQLNSFTPEQLRELRKATVSRIMCDNGDHIQSMQPEGFRVLGEKNQLVPCDDFTHIPIVDLSYWKEEVPPHHFYGKK